MPIGSLERTIEVPFLGDGETPNNFNQFFLGALFNWAEKDEERRVAACKADAQKKGYEASSHALETVSHHKGNRWKLPNHVHAASIPDTIEYLDRTIPKKENPLSFLVKMIRKASGKEGFEMLHTNPAAYQGVPFSVNKELRLSEGKGEEGRRNFSIVADYDANNFRSFQRIKGQERDVLTISPTVYERAYGQFFSALLELANRRGFEEEGRGTLQVLGTNHALSTGGTVPGFNFFPEGMSNGTLLVQGDVGKSCGKHGEGGRIVVTGDADEMFGGGAIGMDFYLGGSVQSLNPGAACKYFICGKVHDREWLDEQRKHNDIVIGDEARTSYDKALRTARAQADFSP